jgi:hypothetical protein
MPRITSVSSCALKHGKRVAHSYIKLCNASAGRCAHAASKVRCIRDTCTIQLLGKKPVFTQANTFGILKHSVPLSVASAMREKAQACSVFEAVQAASRPCVDLMREQVRPGSTILHMENASQRHASFTCIIDMNHWRVS